MVEILRIFNEVFLMWIKDLADDKSTLNQIMAWCREATSHYLNQYWVSSMSPYGSQIYITENMRGFWREMTSIIPWQRAYKGYVCPLSSNLVCNEGQRVSPNTFRANHWQDSTSYCSQKQRHYLHSGSKIRVNMLYCGRVVLPYLKMPILKAWGSASRAQRPLTLRGTTWRNNERCAWNGPRYEHICAFYVEITNIHGVKLKMSCYNRD